MYRSNERASSTLAVHQHETSRNRRGSKRTINITIVNIDCTADPNRFTVHILYKEINFRHF